MITPSEIIYWEILPALRKELVVELRELGLKQKEIAEILDVTPSAISQYLKAKRGKFDFTDKFKIKIKKIAKKVSKGSNAFEEINQLIKHFEKSKDLCVVCKNKNSIEYNCRVCFK